MNYNDYVDDVIGRAFDEDGVFGCQCVDGFKHFCRTFIGYDLSNKSICDGTGYATSIWDNYEKLGLNNYFDKVDILNAGDWAIWGFDSMDCKYSHVAMFLEDLGNGVGLFLGQNQYGYPEYTKAKIHYSGVRGGLRAKCYQKEQTKKKEYINIPSDIEARNVYKVDTKQQFNVVRPQKFGGLSYEILAHNGEFVKIMTSSYGECLVKVTARTPISDHPYYEHGYYL